MKRLPWLVLLVAAVGFVYGLIYLFQLRFESGDNYPEYSTLRADPLGAKAFYESLEPIVGTHRQFRALTRLGEGGAQTLFFLGMPVHELECSPAEFRALETFARSGGRLVIALLPSYQQRWTNAFPVRGKPRALPRRTGTNAPAGPPSPPGLGPPGGDRAEEMRPVSLAERWGWKVEYEPLTRDEKRRYQPATASRNDADPSLPAELRVHSAVYFDGLASSWRRIYARPGPTNELPILIERPLGRGSIVLAADSYPFSNEALRREREASLLAWYVGPNPTATFDETHLGVRVDPGVAALARQYRLGGLFLALLVLAGLFVWKSAVSFMPPYEEQLAREQANQVEGRDSASGFITLLRRNLAPAEVMRMALEEWRTHAGGQRKPSPDRLRAMQELIDAENARRPHQRNPVQLYREFCRILAPRNSSS